MKGVAIDEGEGEGMGEVAADGGFSAAVNQRESGTTSGRVTHDGYTCMRDK